MSFTKSNCEKTTTEQFHDILNYSVPISVAHKNDPEMPIKTAIERRKTGTKFLTAEQSLANMQSAIKAKRKYQLKEIMVLWI